MQKSTTLTIATLTAMLVTLSGCELAKGIFKAGMGVGIIGVVLVLALIVGVMSMMRKA